MTSPLDRVRAVALQLPGAEEQTVDGRSIFLVAGVEFATIGNDAVLSVRAADDQAPDPLSMTLTGDVDWTLVEDRVARSWELNAPADLLEAGGR
jgi:hypothetical protein